MIVKSITAAACAHCGLPVPTGLVNPKQQKQFCCAGCEGAHALIQENGLESFYAMVENGSPPAINHETSSESGNFQEYDELVFQEKYATRLNETKSKIDLAIEGMHCVACIWLIEKLPTIAPGVVEARVNWGNRTVRIVWCQQTIPLSQVAKTLQKLGYLPAPLQPNSHRERWKIENRRHLIRIGVAAACAGNNMVISAALYLGMFSYMTTEMTQLMRVASGVVGLAALCGPGRVFLLSALAALKTRTPHMDLPIALALFVGTVAGLINVVRGHGEIYFDSLSVLILLLLIGRWVQFRQQIKAANAIDLLQQLTPQKTYKFVAGCPVEILVELVEIGDALQIRQGDLFPADGCLTKFKTEVDESILTGEATPIHKSPGQDVWAGTTNLGSAVQMRVTQIGSETRIHQLVELVEEAANTKPQIVQWSNRIGGYFVIAVMLLASFSLAWWFSTDREMAFERSIALLIVACPCALALATPLAIAVAMGRAAQQRIMIKGGDVLQALQQPGRIWLDKTGTLTNGSLHVARWFGEMSWLTPVIALEKNFSHPVARAIINFGNQNRQQKPLFDIISASNPHLRATEHSSACSNSMNRQRAPLLTSIKNHPGQGVSGFVDGSQVIIGNKPLLTRFNVDVANRHNRVAMQIVTRGNSPCWIAINGQIVAIAELRDAIRPEAKASIDELKKRGWKVGILSGDQQGVVDRVARVLSIDPTLALGGITPEEKIDKVKQHQGTTIMVGDGVNDSAALAAATVGIAVKGSAEASLAAAPVYLAKAGLAPILELMDLSQNTAKIMRINLAVSLAYNLTFAALAFFGYINPLVAAILMPISSLTVVAISMTTGRAIRPSPPENVVINRLATATSTRTQPTNYRGAL